MKATIDGDGRIELGSELQSQLGVQPGDDVLLEKQGNEWVIKSAKSANGLCMEGNILVHRGTALPVASEEAELLEDTGPIRLPPRNLRTLKAKVVPGPRRQLTETVED
jgi:bifunctional DNA-binding transcriptional regulator/antitoxin component of YhaV-PrlF toxin-antitoxin module